MADNTSDEQRPSQAAPLSENEDLSKAVEKHQNQDLTVAVAVAAVDDKACSQGPPLPQAQLPPLRPVLSDASLNHHHHQLQDREKLVVAAKGEASSPSDPKPGSSSTVADASREDDLLRFRFMPRHEHPSDRDWADPFSSRGYHDFGYYSDPSYGFPAAQSVPYNPMNHFRPVYPLPVHPVPSRSSSHPRHPFPNLYDFGSLPRDVPTRSEVGRPDANKPDYLAKKEADAKQEDTPSEETKVADVCVAEVAKGKTDEESDADAKMREVQVLLEALKAEKDRSSRLEMELQFKRELEAEHNQRLAQIEAKNERLQQEMDGQKESQKDALARMHDDKQLQEQQQKDQFEKLQLAITKFGQHVAMMEQKEEERRAEEKRKEEEEEAERREKELEEVRRATQEELEREEQQRIAQEEERQEQERLEDERRKEERKKQAEEREKQEKVQSEERIQQMAQEALQRLREEWAQQQAHEAEKRAESERLRQEQEAKDRAAREEMERLMETLRLEKEEQKREDERKREEEQKRTAAEEQARREIDEEVQRNLSERLKAEIERLQSDLRRHTQGARPDLTSGRALTQQQARSEASFGHQEQLDWDPTWKFPPSNPFSSRSRRRALHSHHHQHQHQQPEPRFIEDAVRSPSIRSPSLAADDDPFGDAEEHSPSSHWTYTQPARATPSYAGGAPAGQQTPRFRSSASTPVPLRASVYRDEEVDSVYEGDEAAPESDSQNPWHQGGVGRRARSDGTGRSNPAGSQADVRPASAYVGGGAEGYGMGAAGQYLTKGYVSDAEARSAFRASQYHHASDRRAAATPRPRKTHGVNGAVDPPPVPTPPTETPPHAPRRGRSSQTTPAPSSSGGRFSESGRPTFEGFPPPPSTPASEAASQSSPQLIQYLPLDQASAMAAFKNVPVIMMPVVPLYSLQFGQMPGQDDGTTDGGEGDLEGGYEELSNPYMANGL